MTPPPYSPTLLPPHMWYFSNVTLIWGWPGVLFSPPGHEHSLYVLFDRDGNKVVDKNDIDAAFKLADLNKNNQIDKSELHL